MVLVPGTGSSSLEAQDAAAVAVAEPEQPTLPAVPAPVSADAGGAPSPPPEPEPPREAPEPSLAELQPVKEQSRHEHPTWYPEYRDTLGHQFNQQLVPQLIGLSATELGLPANTDPDRLRREVRALAFARSYLMAQAGDAQGLRAISRDLLYFWDDRLGGTLVPAPAAATRLPGCTRSTACAHGAQRHGVPVRRSLPLPPLRLRGQGLDRRPLEGAAAASKRTPQRASGSRPASSGPWLSSATAAAA